MNYQWVNCGDQDEKLHKRCYLGPHMLEIKEVGWTTSDQPIFLFCFWQWDSEKKCYAKTVNSEKSIMSQKKAKEFAEDYYGENVIFEEIALGTES